MPDAAYLREQAERCRRLAATVTTTDVVETLLAMAREYDERAADLDREAGTAGEPTADPI